MDEELRIEGLKAIENGDLNKARIIESKNKGYSSYVTTINTIYFKTIISYLLVLPTVLLLNSLAKTLVNYRNNVFTESLIRSGEEVTRGNSGNQ